MLAEYEIEQRPVTWSEECFIRSMVEFYAGRLEQNPELKLLRQAYKHYKGVLQTKTQRTWTRIDRGND